MARSFQIRSALVGAALALGALGTGLTLWSISSPPDTSADRCLRVVATGHKAAASQDAQVWLLAVQLDNATALPLDAVGRDAGWRATDTNGRPALLAGESGRQAQLTLCAAAQAAEVVALDFIAHPWSGIVEVQWHGQTQEYDLFAPGGITIRRIVVPQLAARTDLSTVQLGMLGVGSIILLAGALRWLWAMLADETLTAHPPPS